MFFALISIISSCFFGFELVAWFLAKHMDIITMIGIGNCIGIVISAWAFFIISYFIPLSFFHGLLHSVILIMMGVFIQIRCHFRFKITPIPIKILLFSVLIPTVFLTYFFYYGFLYKENYTKGACYGDFPFHLNLISSFAYGCNSQRKKIFQITTPFFANEPLAYPFIPNFYSAILKSCFNTSYHTCLVLPSVFMALSLFIIFSRLVFEFSNSNFACYIFPWLFLLSGGTGFLQWIRIGFKTPYYTDFVNNWAKNVHEGWFQTVIHILMPQRASLQSIPIAYAIILLLIIGEQQNKVVTKIYFLIGLLVASLAQVQPHSIIAVAQWGTIYFLINFKFSWRWIQIELSNYVVIGVVAIIFGLPQTTAYWDRTKNNFIKFAPIWQPSDHKTMAEFWWPALGPFIVLATIHAPMIFNRKQFNAYFPSFCVWLIANYIWYQPWNLDNTKVFNAAWIPLAVCGVSNVLSFMWNSKYRIGKIFAILLLVASCMSGSLAISMAYRETYPEWGNLQAQIEIADFIKTKTNPQSVWITSRWHSHPVTALAGRQTFVGYGGWTSSHGLDDRRREQIMRDLLRNPDDCRAADEYGVEYICSSVGQFSYDFRVPIDNKNWIQIYDKNYYRIYQRNKLAA